MHGKAYVVLNRNAGSVAAANPTDPEAVRSALSEAGFESQLLLAEPGGLETAIRGAVERQATAIFVGGGDGTISTAAALLADRDVPLGVLPLGTLNHFAKDLGLPTDWRAAIAALSHAETRLVDLGEVNGRIFINNCSVGVYAEAVRKRDLLRERHGLGKWRAMWVASWRVFRGMRRMRIQFQFEDHSLDLRTPLVVISNNRYTGQVLNGCVRPRLDEGQLWLHTTRVHRRFTLLRLALQALRRRLDDVDHLETQSFTAGVLTAPNPVLPIAADGELLSVQAPLRFRIRPRALRVMMPRSTS